MHYPDIIGQPPPFLQNAEIFMSSDSSDKKQYDILCKYLRSPVFLGWEPPSDQITGMYTDVKKKM